MEIISRMDSTSINTGNNNFLEEELQRNLLQSKFKTVGKTYFFDYIKYSYSYHDYIKEGGILKAYNIPINYSELFIRYENCFFYWLSEHPIVKQIENWINNEIRKKPVGTDNYSDVRKFFSKWAQQNLVKERHFYALSMLNLLDKNPNSYNFLKYLMFALVFGLDEKLKMYQKSLELLELSKQIATSLDIEPVLKNEILYLLNLFTGFIYMHYNENALALKTFEDCLVMKPVAANALFYKALIETRLMMSDQSAKSLENLWELDKGRMELALNSNNINLVNYFLHYSYIYNIFTYADFSNILPAIEHFLNMTDSKGEYTLDEIHARIDNFEVLDLKPYYNDVILNDLNFIAEYVIKYKQNRNWLVLFGNVLISSKFHKIIDGLLVEIKAKLLKELENQLKVFDIEYSGNLDKIKHLENELSIGQERLKNKLEALRNELESSYNNAIGDEKRKIELLDMEKKFDPQETFTNSMVYNGMLTLGIFILGGFIGTYSGGNDESTPFLSGFLVYGIKWAIITFFIGVVLSLVAVASASMEKSRVRSRLEKRIEQLKFQLQREIEVIKKDSEVQTKLLEEDNHEKIKKLIDRNDKIFNEKSEKEKELRKEMNEKVTKKITQIEHLMRL